MLNAKKLALPLACLVATTLAAAISTRDADDEWTPEDRAAQKARNQWSSIIGWISIACWVIVYSPQLKENYDRKSGEGLSLAFVVIWLAGDLLNLIGAWRQELLGTMIILALYYSLCDIALIFQYYYYRKYKDFYHPQQSAQAALEPTEETPLVPSKAEEPPEQSLRSEIIRYLGAAAIVTLTGVAAWAVEQSGHGSGSGDGSKPEGPGWQWDAQVYGWLSAALYLASRVPQIFKNRQTKCEGLSLALFLFAVAGNVTYVASILLKSTDEEYVIESLSWLVGSLGTVFLDFVVLGQFVAYKEERKRLARSGGSEIRVEDRS